MISRLKSRRHRLLKWEVCGLAFGFVDWTAVNTGWDAGRRCIISYHPYSSPVILLFSCSREHLEQSADVAFALKLLWDAR